MSLSEAAANALTPPAFSCNDCKYEWEGNAKCKPLYEEYVQVKGLTQIPPMNVNELGGRKGGYKYINGMDLLKRTEIAKDLVNLCKSSLDLPSGEWLVIEQNSK